MTQQQNTDLTTNNTRSGKSNWIKFGLLLALPAAGLWYWLSFPNAANGIRTELGEISSSLIDSQSEFVDEDDELPQLGNSGEKFDWQSLSKLVEDDDDSDEAGGNSPGGGSLSPSDSETFARNLRILGSLSPDITDSSLASDRAVQALARQVAGGWPSGENTTIIDSVSLESLSKAQQVEIARAAQANIAELAIRYQSAAMDRSIDGLIQTESKLKVLQKHLRASLPSSAAIPSDPLGLASTTSLKNSVAGLKTNLLEFKQKLALLGEPFPETTLSGKIVNYFETTISRIEGVISSKEHVSFQETSLETLKKISKRTWDKAAQDRIKETREQIGLARKRVVSDTGLQEIRFSSRNIRGPPHGSLDAIALSGLRDFDTAPRRWLNTKAVVLALGDELVSYNEVKKAGGGGPLDSIKRVATLLKTETLERGLRIARGVAGEPESSSPEAQTTASQRMSHFEEFQTAIRAELDRRAQGGKQISIPSKSGLSFDQNRTFELKELVESYTNLEKLPSRVQTRKLALASMRFPETSTVPIGIRDEIRKTFANSVDQYSGRIKVAGEWYQRVAMNLALATDATPDLLETLKETKSEIKAMHRELASMIAEGEKLGFSELKSSKAVFPSSLDGLFLRGPPDLGDNGQPTAPKPTKPGPSGGGAPVLANSMDVERVQLLRKIPNYANPRLESHLYFASARLANAESKLTELLELSKTINSNPVRFATQKGRTVYVSTKGAANTEEPNWKKMVRKSELTRLPKRHSEWQGRLKLDQKTGQHIPYDFKSEVKRPKSFRAVGGGIHFGEIATFIGGESDQFVLRFEDRALVLLRVRDGQKFQIPTPEIDPISVKALLRFAAARRNATISIGWGTERQSYFDVIQSNEDEGSAVLLDPYLVDTKVGQDLVLADSIPWKFADSELLPNGSPIAFHEEFKKTYEDFRAQRLEKVSPIFETIQPFNVADSEEWLRRLRENDAPLILQLAVLNLPLDEAFSWFQNQSILELLKDQKIAATEFGASKSLAKFFQGQILKNSGISSILELDSSQKKILNEAVNEQINKIQDLMKKDFNERIKPLYDGESDPKTRLATISDLIMVAFLGQGKCPTAIIELWASAILATQPDLKKETLSLGFLARMNSTTLAMLYDDKVEISLRNETVSLTPTMRYRYATTSFDLNESELFVGEENDPDNEVETISSLTDIANENLESLMASYAPLKRVANQTALTGFFKWALEEQSKGKLLIDLSELAAYPSHDRKSTPTPDAIVK